MPNKIVNFFNGITQFLKEVKVELKKVSWSTIPELKESTILVLVSIIVMGLVIGLFDLMMSKLIGFVIH